MEASSVRESETETSTCPTADDAPYRDDRDGRAVSGGMHRANCRMMQLASAFVLYSTAFAAMVQIGRTGRQRSIVLLTLTAGFASTIFWPLTSALQDWMDWRGVYGNFALIHLICAIRSTCGWPPCPGLSANPPQASPLPRRRII